MRDILQHLESLEESTGLANRKAGDVFRDSNGKEIFFKGIEFFPKNGGRLEPQELDNIVKQLESENNISWLNARNSRSGGIALSRFYDAAGNTLVFGKYLENIKPNFTNNYVPNHVGDFRYAGKTAIKIQDKLTPQDLLINMTDLTADDILDQLAISLGSSHPLYDLAYQVASGKEFPIEFPKPKDVSFAGFRDYFCEILQPIALQNGQFTGNAEEVADVFLDGSFRDTYISFDQSKTAGLSDSILSSVDGKKVKVSTKGGRGATASVSNLVNSINELEETVRGSELKAKYKDTIDIINEIKTRGQVGAPLFLAVKFEIISQQEAGEIIALRNNPLINMEDLDFLDISDNIKEIARKRNANNPASLDLFYHVMAAIAFEVAAKVNKDGKFSNAAADILNNSALVQVYTKAKEKKDTWVLEEFNTVYPGKLITGVYLSAEKTYYSTGIKGNFTFKIDRGDGVPKDTNIETSVRQVRISSDDEFRDMAANIALSKSRQPRRQVGSSVGNVGREKRS